jgi:CubicO group peptidase (beta-lactamase class C family)
MSVAVMSAKNKEGPAHGTGTSLQGRRKQGRFRRSLQGRIYGVPARTSLLRGSRLAAAAALVLLLLAPAVEARRPVTLTTGKPESAGFSSERLAMLDTYMEGKIATGHIPGATLLVARHGKVVLFHTYGVADTGQPMTREAIFRIFSQTKLVTGVAMMILFEEARWRFDDPVTKYLPGLADAKVFTVVNADGTMATEKLTRPPTLREITTHSAGYGYGLDRSTPVEAAYNDADFMHAADPAEAIRRIASVPMASQPGVHWHYAAGVDLQGYIVEKLSGQSLADFMQQRIFGPLKMNDTAFIVPAEKESRLVKLHVYDPQSNGLVPPTGVLMFDYSKPPGAASGGAGLVSTTSDFARFAQMLLNGGVLDGARILSPSAVRLLDSNHLPDAVRSKPEEPFSEKTGVGFGVGAAVILDPAKAGTLEGKGTLSWGGAAGSWFIIDPENDLFILGMMQVMNRWADPVMNNIDNDTSALVYRALLEPER